MNEPINPTELFPLLLSRPKLREKSCLESRFSRRTVTPEIASITLELKTPRASRLGNRTIERASYLRRVLPMDSSRFFIAERETLRIFPLSFYPRPLMEDKEDFGDPRILLEAETLSRGKLRSNGARSTIPGTTGRWKDDSWTESQLAFLRVSPRSTTYPATVFIDGIGRCRSQSPFSANGVDAGRR